jgi:dihydropyrimidinase
VLDLVVRGGHAVTPWGVGNWDIGVQGERIVAIAVPGNLPTDVGRVIDATGKIVIPGGIEPHAHAAFRFVYPWAQGAGHRAATPDVLSRACAFGGTTTIVDFANWVPGTPELAGAIENRDQIFKGTCYTDYSFHTVLVGMGTEGATPQQAIEIPLRLIDQIKDVVTGGFTTVKVWTTNTTATRARQMTDFGHVLGIMEQIAAGGGVLAVHAEDEDIVMYMSRRLHDEGRTGTEFLPAAHPSISEDIAFRRTIRLAEWTNAAIYLMHTSAKEGVEAIAEARGRGLPVYGETLHHYATFPSRVYETPEGPLYHTYPSLKQEEDNEALWQGLVRGRLATVATDAIVCSRELKLGGHSIEDTVGGNPAVEERLAVTYTEGVVKRGMSLQRFVEVTSTNAAKILGMYPRKGVLAPGSDADIVLLDPSVRRQLAVSDLHGVDHSVWEGWDIHAWPVLTILRGKVIVEDGELKGDPADGRLIGNRKTPSEVLHGAAC